MAIAPPKHQNLANPDFSWTFWCERKIRAQSTLIAWILLFWKRIIVYLILFSVFQGKYKENHKSAQNVQFGSFCVFREFWKSTVTFSDQNDTGHYLESGLQNSVRRFRNNISNPDNFVGEPPLWQAHHHTRWQKHFMNFHLFSLIIIYIYLSIYLIIYFICLLTFINLLIYIYIFIYYWFLF